MKKKTILSNNEISAFCGQIALILKAGINPVEGLGILQSDIKNDEGKEIIQEILDECQKGESFRKAISKSKVFPKYVLDMIYLGEESGNLDDVMESLSVYYEHEENTSESIKSAVTYPIAMITMMLVVIIVLISKVLPIFNQVFIQLGSEMNSFSLGLMNIGTAINRSSLGIIIFLVCCIVLFIFTTKTSSGKILFSKFFVNSIFTRNFAGHIAAGRFASGMALTLESGLDTYHSLDMVAELVDNPKMAKKILDCKSYVSAGDNFSDALTKAEIFSNLYIRMIGIGFKTGSLDVVMRKIADNYEKETDKKIHSVISILEPTLVISLSVIVGMILLSVILPLMGIMSSIG